MKLWRRVRRCSVHDRAWPSTIRRLETELGYEPSPGPESFSENYCNPELIDCGLAWCRRRRNAR